jgi:hypothetical protein
MSFKKLESYLQVNLLGPGPSYKKRIYRAAVSQKVEKHCCTVHLHHAHAARTAASTFRMGRPLQSNSQVQPTHAPMTSDSKATQRLSEFHNHIQLGHRTTLT